MQIFSIAVWKGAKDHVSRVEEIRYNIRYLLKIYILLGYFAIGPQPSNSSVGPEASKHVFGPWI